MAASSCMGCNMRHTVSHLVEMGSPRRPVQCQEEIWRERMRGVNHGDIDMHEDIITGVIDLHPVISELATNLTCYITAPTLASATPPTSQLSNITLVTNLTRYEHQVVLPGPQMGHTERTTQSTARPSVRHTTIYYALSAQATAMAAQFTSGKSGSIQTYPLCRDNL